MSPHECAVAALRAGRQVVLAGPGDGGTVVVAAATATTSALAWTVRHTSGLIRVALYPERAQQLRLGRMAGTDLRHPGPVQTVSVDARDGVTTGISAADRARTVRFLADPATRPADLVSPGHVLVELLGSAPDPTPSATTALAAADLCLAAGLPPVVAMADILDAAGELAGPEFVAALAARAGVPLVATAVPLRAAG